jgi:hypothetical protein
MREFNKPFWQEIKIEDLKNNDIIYLKYDGKGSYEHFVIINNKWFSIFEDRFIDYFKPDKKYPYKIYKQNYRFITKPEEWFDQGTEAYLESYPEGNEKDGFWAFFRGWITDQASGQFGEDGESCLLDEFDITEI